MDGETGIRDLLTGLYARDYFDEIIGRELERSRRHGISLSVLSIVVVNRGELRSTHGEETADAAILEVARVLQTSTRETDFLFRWEDDEILVLLFEADAEACGRKVDQLHELFQPWRDGLGPVPAAVKVRIGAATHDRDVVFAAVLQGARAAARRQTLV